MTPNVLKDSAAEWWMRLTDRQKWAVNRWLTDHQPPADRSALQHAYDHRDQIDLPEPEGG